MDNETWRWLTGGAASLAAALVAVVWGDTKSKLAKLTAEKAERADLDRASGYIKDLYEKLEQHARRGEDNFRDLSQMMAENHAELLRELGRKADRPGAQ